MSKIMASIMHKVQESFTDTTLYMIELILEQGSYVVVDPPVASDQLKCRFCGGSEHYVTMVAPGTDSRRVWMCAKPHCEAYKALSSSNHVRVPPKRKRELEWPLFCEMNGIGDVHHTVSWEKVDQVPEKKNFMLEFANKPRGIVLMRGGAGTGKTYLCMAVCEYFTRRNREVIFLTQKSLFDQWSASFNDGGPQHFKFKLETTKLFVIDDFGIGEISHKFMAFIMDIINTRMQWTDRGTIVNTNLDNNKFVDYCGEALTDRFKTGKSLIFNHPSRRTPNKTGYT